MASNLETAIQRYNRAACDADSEELAEARRILRGRLMERPIPVVACGPWCYAATDKGIGVVRLREGRAGDQ